MEDLRARLQEQPVHYDVARGLDRHRALVAASTPVPEWAKELPAPRSPWLRRVLLWGGALAVLTLAWPRPAPPQQPPASSLLPRAELPAPSHAVVRAPVVRALPKQAAAPREPVTTIVAPAEPTADQVEPASPQPLLPTHRRRRAHRGEPTIANGPSTQSARGLETVSPKDNAELAQLVEAERALATDPGRTLRLAREGELSFRNGYFQQERRYIEVMALFALGRTGEAHAQALAFLRDYPGAPYRRKIEREQLRHPQH